VKRDDAVPESTPPTLRDKIHKEAFWHECDQGGGKYILLLDDVDALLAEESTPPVQEEDGICDFWGCSLEEHPKEEWCVNWRVVEGEEERGRIGDGVRSVRAVRLANGDNSGGVEKSENSGGSQAQAVVGEAMSADEFWEKNRVAIDVRQVAEAYAKHVTEAQTDRIGVLEVQMSELQEFWDAEKKHTGRLEAQVAALSQERDELRKKLGQ
jgi:hypothetical protein